MKRYFLLLLAALSLLLTLALPAAADSGRVYVYDLTGAILTAEEGNALQDKAAEISRRHDCGVYIVVLNDYEDYGWTVPDASETIYWEYDFGHGQDSSGIMLMMSMNERDYDVYSYGYGTYAMDRVDADDFDAPMLRCFRNDDWYHGFDAYLDTCDAVLTDADSSYDPADYNSDGTLVDKGPNIGMNSVIGLVIGLISALISCSIGKAKMKTVHAAADAENYTVPNSMHLQVKQDVFSHKTETRTKIETSSDRSSGGGGGGRPSGGSSHHGGKF